MQKWPKNSPNIAQKWLKMTQNDSKLPKMEPNFESRTRLEINGWEFNRPVESWYQLKPNWQINKRTDQQNQEKKNRSTEILTKKKKKKKKKTDEGNQFKFNQVRERKREKKNRTKYKQPQTDLINKQQQTDHKSRHSDQNPTGMPQESNRKRENYIYICIYFIYVYI